MYMKKFKILIVVLLVAALAIFMLSGCAGTQGPAGVDVSGANVNSSGHLVLTLSNGQTIDAGSAVGPPGPAGLAFNTIVPQVEPTIVRINVTVTGGIQAGSGTIIDPRGYIVTNAHVINGGQGISVTLMDGTILAATVVASDTTKDLAIIKLTSTQTNYPTMPLGTMNDVLVGEDVMAVGFPAGTDLPGPATFTAGVVSALRTYSGANYIQTDTPVNPGNSGGCLFTTSGKMVGIPSEVILPANADFEDINLAIPIDLISAYITANVK